MLGSLGRVGGRGGSGAGPVFGARLIQPGAIAGGAIVSFSRSQVSSFSSAPNASGSYVEYAADITRFNSTAQRLLLEGQRTNEVPNPRCVGAVAGTPGTQPTGWTRIAAFSNLNCDVAGFGVEDGIPYCDFRIYGTPNITAASSFLLFLSAGIAPATSGQVRTASYFVRVVAGSMSNVSFTRVMLNNGGSGSILGATFTPTTSALSTQRFFHTTTANAGTTSVNSGIRVNYTILLPIDVTIRVGAPQQELGLFASTPVLPNVGAVAASTRGQDNFTSSFSSLFPTGVGTVLMSCMIPQSAPTGIDQVLLDINDGSANNRIRLRNVAAGNTIVAGRTIATVNTDATTLGSMTPGTLFRVGLTFDGTEIVANFNGGTNQTVAGVPTGLTTLRIGNNSAGTGALFGEAGYVDVLPYVIPAANLPAAVTAIP
jgi:hypothetical protein